MSKLGEDHSNIHEQTEAAGNSTGLVAEVDLVRQFKISDTTADTILSPYLVLVSEKTEQAVLLRLTVLWENIDYGGS